MIPFSDYIKRALRVILLQVVFTLMICSFCLAYFSDESVKLSIKTITSHTDTLPSSASHYFVWSDNDEFHTNFSSNFVAWPQEAWRYIYAFYMPIWEIATQQRGQYVPSEFSLDNLLYANLKNERLINEYNRLKVSSRQVLEGLDVPYISWTPAFESNFEKRGYTISNKMDNINNHPGKFSGPDFIGSKPVNRSNRINSQRTLQSKAKMPLSNTQPPINSSSNLAEPGAIFSKNQDRRSSNLEPEASTLKKNVKFYDGLDERLLRLLRLLKSILIYAMENKYMGIFYIFMLFGVCYLLFGMRK